MSRSICSHWVLAPLAALALLGSIIDCRQVAGLEGDYIETTTTGASSGTGASAGSGVGGGAGSGGGASGGASGDCFGCAADDFCDPSQGCVDCTEEAHCTEPDRPACIDGKCRECLTTTDCLTAGEVCYPDYKCGPPCADDGDCPDFCDTSTSLCVQCFTAADCTDKLCHPTRQKCVECLADADCPVDLPRCELHSGNCKGCLVNGDCGPAEVCDRRECAPR